MCKKSTISPESIFLFWGDSSKLLEKHHLPQSCFLSSFEKVPVNLQDGASVKPLSDLWRLTEEGHCHFQEETCAWASVRWESVQQHMSQPDVMNSLFDLWTTTSPFLEHCPPYWAHHCPNWSSLIPSPSLSGRWQDCV